MDDVFVPLHTELMQKGHVVFVIRVHPGAKRTAIRGAMADGTIKIDVSAHSKNGEANRAACAYIAKCFGVHHSSVAIITGHRSRRKMCKITSL